MALACVDQPIFPVERTGSGGTGGAGGAASSQSSSSGDEGDNSSKGGNGGVTGATTENKGGRASSGGASSSSIVGCAAKLDADCTYSQCCSKGLSCGPNNKCCKDNDQPCATSTECCSGKCTNNICTNVRSTKITANYETPCTDDDDCFSGKCDYYYGSFTKVCQSIEGCKPIGEPCSGWSECCSGNCAWGVCQLRPNVLCRSPGDVCTLTTEAQYCCEGSVCKVSAEGVPRCLKRRSDCVEATFFCSVAGDCCPIGNDQNGHCLQRTDKPLTPKGDDFGTCQTCVTEGRACNADFDCCATLRCDLVTSRCIPKD